MAVRPMPEKENYPNNSDRARIRHEEDREKPIAKKVTTGKVVQKKKSLARRMKEAFGINESQGVLDYIFFDIIIPATKNMLMDSIANGAEMMIFGETRGRRDYRRGYGGGARYAYDRVSYRGDDYGRGYGRDRDRDRDRDRERERDKDRAPLGMNDYMDLIYVSKSDARGVLDSLLDMIDAYDQATVRDLYEAAGFSCEYTCGNYGWRNLATASISAVSGGYVLDLPRAIPL